MNFWRKESEQEGMRHCAESGRAVPTRGCLRPVLQVAASNQWNRRRGRAAFHGHQSSMFLHRFVPSHAPSSPRDAGVRGVSDRPPSEFPKTAPRTFLCNTKARYAGFRAAMLLALNPIQRKYCLHRAPMGDIDFLFSKSNHRAGHHDPGCTAACLVACVWPKRFGTAAADDGAAVLPLCCAQNTGGRHDIPCGSRGSPRAAPGGSGFPRPAFTTNSATYFWGIPWRMAAGQSDPCDVGGALKHSTCCRFPLTLRNIRQRKGVLALGNCWAIPGLACC